MKRILTVLTLAAVLVGNAIAAQQVYNPGGVLKNYQIGPSDRTQFEGGWESWLLNHQQWIRSLPRPLPTDVAEAVLIQNVEVFVDGYGVFYTLRFDEDGNYTVESGLVGKKPERVISKAQIQDQVKQQMLDFSRKPTEPKAKPKLSSFSLGAIIEAGYSKEELKEARFDFSFRRNMVQAELNTACKGTGSAESCKETFEAASLAVLINDPDKGGAAEWTGRKAKEVSDDLVKLGGTQEQLMDVIKASTDNVKYIEKTLPASTRIDGPKEAAALNLVQASLNLMKTKPATPTVIDDPANCGSDSNFDRCFEPPIIGALKQVSSLGSPAINRVVIEPVVRKYEKQVELLGKDSGVDQRKSTGSVSRNVETDSVVAFQGIVAATSVAVQAATRGWEENKEKEAKKHSEQRDAANTVLNALQTSTQTQVVLQQPQQQQQQQNCNPQFQDC